MGVLYISLGVLYISLGVLYISFGCPLYFFVEVATCVSKWGFARVFAECVDKIYFDPARSPTNLDEQAFEQVVSRFEKYLTNISEDELKNKAYGLLIHDNNETVAQKHTQLMKAFHDKGTNWIDLEHIIETPLFVNSELTSLVQMAPLTGPLVTKALA